MQKYFIFIIILIITIWYLSCQQKSTEPVEKKSYTPLSVGDKTQIIFMLDSSTVSLEIIDTAERTDGQKVYKGLYKSGTQIPDVSYYYVSAGFFIATELDIDSSDTLLMQMNPFHEQRLAKSYPSNGDTWLHTPGDTLSAFFIAGQAESFHTLWGEVKNVFKFDLYDKKETIPFMTLYYGTDLGWIGTSTPFGDEEDLQFVCSYKRVSGEVYGEFWPEKDVSPFLKNRKSLSKYAVLSHLNNKLPYIINGERVID